MILETVKKNKITSFFIVSLFIIVIMAGVYFVCMANNMGVYSVFVALFVAIIPAFVSYYNSDKMVLLLNGAKPATKEQGLELNSILEGLCIAAGLPQPSLYVINDSAPNAFATGRNPNHAAICVTTGLLEKLDKYELEGVLAHELSHIKNYDILLSTIVSVFVGFVVILSDFLLRFGFRSNRRNNKESSPFDVVVFIISILFLLLSPVFSTLMQLVISRKREYLADASAIEITRNKEGLIRALKKISEDKDMVVESANKSTAHMFIYNPLNISNKTKEKDSIWSTHPAITNRIKALENIK